MKQGKEKLKIAVVIVAAGRGERAGKGDGPKQYRPMGGRPVIAHTVDVFRNHPAISAMVIAIHPDDEGLLASALGNLPPDTMAVHGGPTRQASTLRALRALRT